MSSEFMSPTYGGSNANAARKANGRYRLLCATLVGMFALIVRPSWALEVAYFNTYDDAYSGCQARMQQLQASSTYWSYSCQWIKGASPQYVEVPSNTWGIFATPNNLCFLGTCLPDQWVWDGFYPITQCTSDQTFDPPRRV